MMKVITYGTYDHLHRGHVRLLERAKALGDYLIVGVTSDDFDKQRGKINVQQPLEERIAAVRATGIADKIISRRRTRTPASSITSSQLDPSLQNNISSLSFYSSDGQKKSKAACGHH